MDIPDLLKYYSPEQKNIFTGFCITLPTCFTLLYLYIPNFQECVVFLQIIFSITASTLSICFSFAFLSVASILSRKKYKLNTLILIFPIQITGIRCIVNPNDFQKGYEFLLSNFWTATAAIFIPLALIGFCMRKAKEYDRKHRGKNCM